MSHKLLAVAAVVMLQGCSGALPSFGDGPVVPPSRVARFAGGGSLSTLWYRGSDKDYHYFAHYVKASTKYRVRRSELDVPGEFPHKSRDPVFIGNSPIWRDV